MSMVSHIDLLLLCLWFHKALEALYSCNPYKLPTFLHNSAFLLWSEKMINIRAQDNNYLHVVSRCATSKSFLHLKVSLVVSGRVLDLTTGV